MSETRFAEAVRHRDIETLKTLLDDEPGLVSSRDVGSAESWLDLCFRFEQHHKRDDCECVELLVNHGANINGVQHIILWIPVLHAVNVDCSRCLRLLVEKGADLSISNLSGDTALIHAVKWERLEIAEFLIQHSTPTVINHMEKNGKTALMWAAGCRGKDSPSLCQQLIDAGADVNITDEDGNTALILALKDNACANVVTLIRNSTPAVINDIVNCKNSALTYADPFYELIMKAGPDLNLTDKDGRTVLMCSIQRDKKDFFQGLIQHFTPELINHRDNDGKTALMYAAKCYGQDAPSFCKQLIEAGADLNIRDTDRKTALQIAVLKGTYANAVVLIRHSTPAMINRRDNDKKTILMWTVDCPRKDFASVCEQLIEAGADLNITDENGNTALILALKRKAFKCAEVFIQNSTSSSINHRDNDGKTALWWTLFFNQREVFSVKKGRRKRDRSHWTSTCEEQSVFFCKKLIEAGADLKITYEDGNTALILALKRKAFKCAEVFIQHSTPPLLNYRDNGGRTALIWTIAINQGEDLIDTEWPFERDTSQCTPTCEEQSVLLCKKLIDAGADLNITDGDGNTALILAVKRNYVRCAEVLIRHSSPASLNHRDNGGRSALTWAILVVQEKYYFNSIREHEINTNGFYEEIDWLAHIPKEESVPLLEQLIETGADVNVRDNDDMTALSIAINAMIKSAVSILIKKGAIVNTISFDGNTPFKNALDRNHFIFIHQLLKEGADPTFSLKHTGSIHQQVLNNNPAILRTLVINGFPPQDCTFTKNGNLLFKNTLQHYISPLCLALWENKPATARYLITNKFFTPSDINHILAHNTHLQQQVTDECLQILEFHLKTVQTLSTLCLVTISSALTQNFREYNVGKEASSTEWKFTPTFKERVESLGLPPKLQRALLHQTPSSRICCGQWKNISLEEERQFPVCNECKFCTR